MLKGLPRAPDHATLTDEMTLIRNDENEQRVSQRRRLVQMCVSRHDIITTIGDWGLLILVGLVAARCTRRFEQSGAYLSLAEVVSQSPHIEPSSLVFTPRHTSASLRVLRIGPLEPIKYIFRYAMFDCAVTGSSR